MAYERREQSIPVAIIGAGPAGLVTSLLLSKFGVHHVLIEKYPTTAHTPRAHIINQRTIEIFRDLGIEEEFSAIAMPWDLMENVVWHESLNGLELARRQSWGTSPERRADYTRSSPCPMANCGQHLLEPMLLAAVQRSRYVDLRLGHEFIKLSQSATEVIATVNNRSTGDSYELHAQYLVGADGGRSKVAETVGLLYDGEESISASATIYFNANLAKYTSYRPGVLYWNMVPGLDGFRGAGTLICHRPWYEWALAFSYDPDLLDATDTDLAMERLCRIIGDDTVEIEIRNISTWWINRLVAQDYSADRVFCMGDAVHRHPPTNGLGLNTSVGDAYNLAWKLALVVGGQASPRLLDTYSLERQPHGKRIVDRAYASLRDMERLREAFEFSSRQREDVAESALARLYETGRTAEKLRDSISDALTQTDHQFNAHGVEVGYRYRRGALVSDGTSEPLGTSDADLYDHSTTWPGSHLPHAWLDDGSSRVSTLDLIEGPGFMLLTGIGGEAWEGSVARAQVTAGVAIELRYIGTRDGLRDCYGDWRRLSEVKESGCVLVRADRHVAWRAPDASARYLEALPDVVLRVLGRSSLVA